MIITAESVTAGHPDKLCDQISDAILDAYLARDPQAKVACEAFITTQHVVLGGEVSATDPLTKADRAAIVRKLLLDIGYDDMNTSFDAHTCTITDLLHEQSPEIHQGVVTGGAGDQGSMFGYACHDTATLMPFPIYRSHRLAERLQQVRQDRTIPFLYPDGKVQLSVHYVTKDGILTPTHIDTLLISTQHHAGIAQEDILQALKTHVIEPTVGAYLQEDTRLLCNPTGSFVVGGPHGDCGLTGRKIIVDTYGGAGKHGGGAFSGKDPSKVDRSAAYMARRLAKHIVQSGWATHCEVQLSYAIGVAQPVGSYVDCFNTQTRPLTEIEDRIKTIDCIPKGIIDRFTLQSPIYLPTACYGHFGKEGLPWEE